MPVTKNDKLYKTLASVAEQTRDVMIKYRVTVANIQARTDVPLEEKLASIAKNRTITIQRLTTLEEGVSLANQALAQQIDDDLNPALSDPQALLAELHKTRMDAQLQALFAAKANEGPVALMGAIKSAAAKAAQKNDWAGMQAVREAADDAIDLIPSDGGTAAHDRLRADLLGQVDQAAVSMQTPVQQNALAIQNDITKGTSRVNLGLLQARYSVATDDFDIVVQLPTFEGEAVLQVEPQKAQVQPGQNWSKTDYNLPELPDE
jgi:hypothetical protein